MSDIINRYDTDSDDSDDEISVLITKYDPDSNKSSEELVRSFSRDEVRFPSGNDVESLLVNN